MMNYLRSLFGSEKGSVLAIAAAGIFLVTISTGLAIDTSRYLIIKSQFQKALDTALLAGVSSQDSAADIEETVIEFFYANFPENYMGVNLSTDISVRVDPVNFSWTAEANAEMPTAFGSIVGLDGLAVNHDVTVTWDVSKRVDAVFTLNTSGSMCTTTLDMPQADGSFLLRHEPDHECKKFNAMKTAMEYVISNAFEPIQGVDGPVFNIGIIPYNHKIKFPDGNNVPPALTAVEDTHELGDAEYFANVLDAEPLYPLIPLTPIETEADRQMLLETVMEMRQIPEGGGWNRSNLAALASALMLDPTQHEYFGGKQAAAFDPMAVDKVVVLMTDGSNVGCCFAAYPEGNYDNQYLYLYDIDNGHLSGEEQAAERARKYAGYYGLAANPGICDRMKEAGITIYTVLFDVDETHPGGEEIKTIFRDCASNEQFFFDAKDEQSLILAYQTITDSFNRLRITY